MAKIDLRGALGLSVVYENHELVLKDTTCKEKLVVSIDDMREQLLNKELDCPDVFYTKYKQIDTKDLFTSKNLKLNIYTMEPNLAGIEYVKTRATRCNKYPRIFEVLYGTTTILIQRYKSPKENRIIRIQAKKGDKVIVPAGYDFIATNTRQSSILILAEIMSINAVPRVTLDDNNGIAYYVIRKNAKQEIVRNPNYKIVNELEKVNMIKIVTELGITPKTTITKQIIRKYDKFDWLFKEDSVNY